MENSLQTTSGIEGPVTPERPGAPIVESVEPPVTEDLSHEDNDVFATIRYNHLPLAGSYQVRFEIDPLDMAGSDGHGKLTDIRTLLSRDPTFDEQYSKYEAFRVDNLSFEYQYANNLMSQHTTMAVSYVQDPARTNIADYAESRTVFRPSTYQFARIGDFMSVSIPCASNWFYTDSQPSRFSSPGSVYFVFWGSRNPPDGATEVFVPAPPNNILPKVTVLANVTFKCPTLRSDDVQVQDYISIDPSTFTYKQAHWNDDTMPYPGSLVFDAKTKFDSAAFSDAVAFLVTPGTATLDVKYADVDDAYSHELTLSRCAVRGNANTSTLFIFDVSELNAIGDVESTAVTFEILPNFRVFYTESNVMK